jgi:hypothetical protein
MMSAMQPRDVMQAISAKTGDIGASFYFQPDTLAVGKQLGLDGFRFYLLGRAGVLGDVEAGVVHSAFGYFHPALVARLWESAKQVVPPRQAARAMIGAAHDHGRRIFAGLEGLDAYAGAAGTVIAAVDGGAMALFAGVRAEPVPDDAPAAAMHQAMVLREMRGSAHLAAITAVGLRTEVAHAIKRPNDVEMFGWKDNPPVVTDAARALWQRAEELTNDALEGAFAALSSDQAAALVAGTDAMHAAL